MIKRNALTPSFPDRPLMSTALGFCFGLILAREILGKSAWVLAAIFVLCGVVFVAIKLKHAAIILIMCALGLLRLNIAYPSLPRPADQCVLTGRVCETPIQTEYGWQITLNEASYDAKPIDGKVMLTISGAFSAHEPKYGDSAYAVASLSLPRGPRNEGGMDTRFYYFTKGISCTAYAKAEQAEFLPGDIDLYGRLLLFREKTTKILVSLIGTENGALAACMLHGDTSEIPSDTLNDFRGSGVAHLLAVSGLHVSIIVGVLLAVLKRVKPLLQLILIAVFLLFYSAFTAFSPSTIRASVMALCLLSGRALTRRNDPLTSLSAAFLILTLISPFSVFMTGLQLSFTAVLGILLLYPVLRKALAFLPDSISAALGLSIGGQIATFPATAAYFGRLPIFAVFANMLIVPLAPLVVLPAGIALLVYPVSSVVAGIVAGVADVSLILMRSVASLVSGMGAFSAPSPSFFTCMLFFLSILFISKQHLAAKKTKLVLGGCCAVLCAITWMTPIIARPRAYVDVLDVYSGYAVYLHSSDNSTLIGDERVIGSNTVTAYMRSSGIRSYTIRATQNSGTIVVIGNEELQISPGFVTVRGECYSTAANGRIRVQLSNNSDDGLLLSSYARDEIYDILIE